MGLASPLLLPATDANAQYCQLASYPVPTAAHKARHASSTIKRATAIIDGEVIRPMTGTQPALVRAARVLKGARKALFEIKGSASCGIDLKRRGLRARMTLAGGPEVYDLMPESFTRYEDRLLGSDRRKVWPFRSGEAEAPK